MKNNLLKFVMFAFVMATNFAAFAQPSDEGGVEEGDPSTPINSQLIWLAIAGITFAVFYFANRQKQNKVA